MILKKAFLSEGVRHLHKSDVSVNVDYRHSKADDFNCQFRLSKIGPVYCEHHPSLPPKQVAAVSDSIIAY